MALKKVSFLRGGRSSTKSSDGRSYVHQYQVTFTNFDDILRISQVADDGTTAIPLLGESFPTDANVVVANKEVLQVKMEPVTIVTVTYATRDRDTNESPFSDPARVNWGFAAINQVVEKDLSTNKPIDSSAGEVLVPGLEQESYNLTLTVVRNFVSFDPVDAKSFIGKINFGSVDIDGTVWANKTVLCRDFSGSFLKRNGTPYYAVTQQFEFANSWDREVIDQGTYYIDGGNKVLFRNAGEKSPTVTNLDGSGSPLIEGNNAEFLTFTTRNAVSFTSLDLDNLTF